MREHLIMFWREVPRGSALWAARVEVFVDGKSAQRVVPAVTAVSEALYRIDPENLGPGGDEGTGLAPSPVVGLVFGVAADSPGEAIQAAVDIVNDGLGTVSRGLFAASVVVHVPGGPRHRPNPGDSELSVPAEDPGGAARWRRVGAGRDLWHTRVETFVHDDSARRLADAAAGVSGRLQGDGRGARADQGTGLPADVIGLTFAVAADSPGDAAQVAVETAMDGLGANARALYGVSVFRAEFAPADMSGCYPTLMD